MEPVTSQEPTILEDSIAIERAYFVERALAAFVDNFLLKVPMFLLTFLVWLPLINNQTDPYVRFLYGILAVLLELAVNLGYFAGYAYKNNGQTFGKRWIKIKVADLNGDPLTITHFIVREFLARGIPIVGVLLVGNWSNLWLLTYFLALTKGRRALHDIIAGTQVIRD